MQMTDNHRAARRAADFPAPTFLGYAMPAEWETHDATWIAWPHQENDWPGKFATIPWVFAEIVRLLAEGERVEVLVQPSRNGRCAKEVREILERADVNNSHVTLHEQATDRVWTRDCGPIFVARKKGAKRDADAAMAVVDFKFNAWAKYDDSSRDDKVAGAVAGLLKLPRFEAYGENNRGEYQRFVLEGGSVEVNGAGCVLTTEECLLSKVQQRNPGFSRERIERTLADYLGIENVLWLGKGIAGDDTHGHVDDAARFVDARTIVACVEGDKRDANYAALRDNWRRLEKMRDTRGKAFELVELPVPSPVYFAGQRLPASYANFYIANSAVLVPVFNDAKDAEALGVLAGCFKDRPVVGVYCRDLVWGLGTVHCMTQQQPEGGG